jgi:hypothetical protein
MPFIAIAAIIALCVGGGVTVAADHAKPGEALYTYKTEVNDNAREVYHSIKASLNVDSDTHIESENEANVETETEAQVESEQSGSASGTYLSGSVDLDTSVGVEVR